MESLPWRFLIAILLLTITIGIAFYEIKRFRSVRDKAKAHQGIEGLIEKMKTLRTSSDLGSFDRVDIVVEKGRIFNISKATDSLKYRNKEYPLPGNITKGVKLQGPQAYEIAVYYGELNQELANRDKTIIFK